jgi:CheY-like chemotaxis protein
LGTERPARVLIVEDNSEVMAVLRELLLRSGYDVQEARHGAEALVQLSAPRESLPDLVILDIGLPLEGGVGVLAFLRRTVHSALPVIVLTASATLEQEREIQQLGVSAYLRKPASSDLLLAEVKRALAAREKAR